MSEKRLQKALHLVNTMPPVDIVSNLTNISQLAPDLAVQLSEQVQTPHQIDVDPTCGQSYIKTQYNRDGQSYRSPHSNQYYPAVDEGAYRPSGDLLELENKLNAAFKFYTRVYFGTGKSNPAISSCYVWKQGQTIFCAIAIHNEIVGAGENVGGFWDSFHLVNIEPQGSNLYTYEVESSVTVHIFAETNQIGKADICGSLSKSNRTRKQSTDILSHVENIGPLIESNETQLRDYIESIYFGKTRDVIEKIHLSQPPIQKDAFLSELYGSMLKNRQSAMSK
ncbi:hypothetical protein PCE1_004721 [Barthelona sp. PCE]